METLLIRFPFFPWFIFNYLVIRDVAPPFESHLALQDWRRSWFVWAITALLHGPHLKLSVDSFGNWKEPLIQDRSKD